MPPQTPADFEKWADALQRDRDRKWWQAKEVPNNIFDRAPLLWLCLLTVWLMSAIAPLIVMVAQL